METTAKRRVIIQSLPKKAVWTGDVMRKKREELGITKAQLAKELKTSPQNVYYWERKNSNIDPSYHTALERILVAKEVPVLKKALPEIQTKDLVTVSPQVEPSNPTVTHPEAPEVQAENKVVTACSILREIKTIMSMLRTGGMDQATIDRLMSWRDEDAELLQLALDTYVNEFKTTNEMTEAYLALFNEADTKRTEIAKSVVRKINEMRM